MKKIYAIAAAMMLGGLGFSANAQYHYGESVTMGFFSNMNVTFENNTGDSAPLSLISDSSNPGDAQNLKFEFDMEIMEPFSMSFTTILMSDGKYAYNLDSNIGTSGILNIQFVGFDNVTFTFSSTLAEGEVVEDSGNGGVGDTTPIYLNETFTASYDTKWSYQPESGMDVYLLSNSGWDLIQEESLKITIDGYDYTSDWTPVYNASEDIYAYNGMVNEGNTYVFEYSGNANVEFTLKQGVYTAAGAQQTMNYATQVNDEVKLNDIISAIEVTWGQEVRINDLSKAIFIIDPYTGERIDRLDPTYLNLVKGGGGEPGVATRADDGDQGDILYILTGASGQFTTIGVYTIVLPEGLVVNNEGLVNPEQSFNVYVVEGGVEGVVSPEENTIFPEGEEVIFTITFDGVVEENYSEDAPVYMTNYYDVEEYIYWGSQLYIEGNQVIVNFGSLPEGNYYWSFRDEQVVVDGSANIGFADYMFSVSNGATPNVPGYSTYPGKGLVNALETISISFTEPVSFFSDNVMLVNTTTGESYGATVSGDDYDFNISFGQAITAPGAYELTISNVYYNYYQDVTQYTIKYYIAGETSVAPNGSFDKNLAVVTLNWSGNTISANDSKGAYAQVFDSSNSLVGTLYANNNDIYYTSGIASFKVNTLNLEAGEKYTLSLPAGVIYFGNADSGYSYNKAFTYEFTYSAPTTGIDGIDAEAAVEVYNLNGVKVGDSLKGLAKGLYIVNGKKVMIRK